MTTQREIRAAFWGQWLGPRKPGGQNAQTTDTRCAFVDFVDILERAGMISEKLAGRVTL